MTLAAFWERLIAVTRSEFAVKDGGVQREGSGTVTIHRPDPLTIVWEETGTWRGPAGSPTHYRDRLRWERQDARGLLVLHHARRGDTAPVHLGDLAPGPDGIWRSLAPHLCGADRYDSALTVEGSDLVVAWRVEGPRKQYAMVRRYR